LRVCRRNRCGGCIVGRWWNVVNRTDIDFQALDQRTRQLRSLHLFVATGRQSPRLIDGGIDPYQQQRGEPQGQQCFHQREAGMSVIRATAGCAKTIYRLFSAGNWACDQRAPHPGPLPAKPGRGEIGTTHHQWHPVLQWNLVRQSHPVDRWRAISVHGSVLVHGEDTFPAASAFC
jgi:hypothetical protein